MKTLFRLLFLSLGLGLVIGHEATAQAQNDSTKTHMVIKRDGTEFIGRILSQDAREVLIETKEMGQIIIPKHEIKEIKELMQGDFNFTGQYIPDEVFSTRYFITTNGLPIEKGESYIQWNLYGPDFQLGVAKNFGVGIMTSWVAVPIIASAKYSIKLDEKVSLGLGTLLGTGSWSIPDFSLALPFAAFTLGDRKASLTFSGGYGVVTHKEEQYNSFSQVVSEKKVADARMLMSIAFMFKVGRKVSFVFDSFIVPKGAYYDAVAYRTVIDGNGNFVNQTYTTRERKESFALVIPGIRWQMDSKRAFQFGFTGVQTQGYWWPLPVPMVQWYRKI